MLATGERWELYASYVSGGGVPDMCQSPHGTSWACLRSTGTTDWSCLPMSEACAGGRTRQGIAVTSDDLLTTGIDIELRATPNGPVLARRFGARYSRGVTRRALCSGLKFDALTDVGESGIDTFAYFLQPL